MFHKICRSCLIQFYPWLFVYSVYLGGEGDIRNKLIHSDHAQMFIILTSLPWISTTWELQEVPPSTVYASLEITYRIALAVITASVLISARYSI